MMSFMPWSRGQNFQLLEVIFLQQVSVHWGLKPNPLPPPQMLFSCSSSSQHHKYNCVIVPMSLYIVTEITQRGLVSERKTT